MIGIVFLVLIFRVLYPLTMGYLFPWEEPTAPDAPYSAVLRITAPEDEPYTIEWGGESDTVDSVAAGNAYKDYVVRPEAFEQTSADGSGDFDITVYVGNEEVEQWEEGDLGAVLFVDGQYAECGGASGTEGVGAIYIDWQSYDEIGGFLNRMVCGSYRYA